MRYRVVGRALSLPLLFTIVWGETVSEVKGRISLVSKRVFASASTMVMVEFYLGFFFNIFKLHENKR